MSQQRKPHSMLEASIDSIQTENDIFSANENLTKKYESLPLELNAQHKPKFKKHEKVFGSLRFQFVFGGKPEDHMPGKNITGNFTVTYIVPYNPKNFNISLLKQFVETEHDNNIRYAHRMTNIAKKQEHIHIAKLSIESIRTWFRTQKLDSAAFMSAVETACENNYTTYIENSSGEHCTLAITPVHRDSLLG